MCNWPVGQRKLMFARRKEITCFPEDGWNDTGRYPCAGPNVETPYVFSPACSGVEGSQNEPGLSIGRVCPAPPLRRSWMRPAGRMSVGVNIVVGPTATVVPHGPTKSDSYRRVRARGLRNGVTAFTRSRKASGAMRFPARRSSIASAYRSSPCANPFSPGRTSNSSSASSSPSR